MVETAAITTKPLSILVADDHPAFRLGFVNLIKEAADIGFIDQAGNGEEVISMSAHKAYDIIFLDVEMPVKSGLDTLLEFSPANGVIRPKFIIVSSYCEKSKILDAYRKGIHGYILKSTSLKEIRRAISLVADGENYYSSEVSEVLFRNLIREDDRVVVPQVLTLQEKKILELICKQYSNQEIAEALFISELTVKRHRQNIKSKTDTKNIVGFVLYAVKIGIISL